MQRQSKIFFYEKIYFTLVVFLRYDYLLRHDNFSAKEGLMENSIKIPQKKSPTASLDKTTKVTPQKKTKSTFRITSLALGILTLFCACFLGVTAMTQRSERIKEAALAKQKFVKGENDELGKTKEKYAQALLEIKNLKNELIETMSKLHEIRGGLYVKGDSSDKEKLASFAQEIVEKETQNRTYLQRLEELEKEREFAQEKISRQERTIDALAAMNSAETIEKEAEAKRYKEEVEHLAKILSSEREQMKGEVATLNGEKETLQKELEKQNGALAELFSEISWVYQRLEEKEAENHTGAELFRLAHKELSLRIQDLYAALELEAARKLKLESELRISETKEAAHLAYKNALDSRFQELETQAALKETLIRDNLDLSALLSLTIDANNQNSLALEALKERDKESDALLADRETAIRLLLSEVDFAKKTVSAPLENELEQATSALTELSYALEAASLPALDSYEEETIPMKNSEELANESETLEGEGKIHTVLPGDNLFTLSLEYYGTKDRWQEIYESNASKIPNMLALDPGVELIIP